MDCFSCWWLSINPRSCGRRNLEWTLLDSSRSLCETRSFTSWRAYAKSRIARQCHLTFLLMHSVILVSVFHIIINFTIGLNALFLYILSALDNPPLLSILGARLLFNMKEDQRRPTFSCYGFTANKILTTPIIWKFEGFHTCWVLIMTRPLVQFCWPTSHSKSYQTLSWFHPMALCRVTRPLTIES